VATRTSRGGRARNAAIQNSKLTAPVPILLTSGSAGVRDSGTGFCVHHDGKEATIITCAHVIKDLDPELGDIRVNGCQASSVTTADDRGIDLAVLVVPDLILTAIPIESAQPAAGAPFIGAGFAHLSGNQFISRTLRGTVSQMLTMRAQLARSGVDSLLLKADEHTEFSAGNSGAAILNVEQHVIGVLAYASRDGREGYAISSATLLSVLPPAVRAVTAPVGPTTDLDEDARPLPPGLPAIKFPDDPQKGRFGGRQQDGDVKLTATLRRVSGSSHFVFDASVASTRSDLQVLAPARFYLHDSFPRTVIQITKRDENGGYTLSEVSSYGIFTLGCHVFASDGRWHAVEFDLGKLPELPEIFHSR
jgi:hypothetical protein